MKPDPVFRLERVIRDYTLPVAIMVMLMCGQITGSGAALNHLFIGSDSCYLKADIWAMKAGDKKREKNRRGSVSLPRNEKTPKEAVIRAGTGLCKSGNTFKTDTRSGFNKAHWNKWWNNDFNKSKYKYFVPSPK